MGYVTSPLTMGYVTSPLTMGYVTSPLTMGYVTSPLYDGGLHAAYGRLPYAGEMILNVTNQQSLFIRFHDFLLGLSTNCSFGNRFFGHSYLQLSVLGTNTSWTKCGRQRIEPETFFSSIKLFFVIINIYRIVGFKMMFVILPRSKEPEMIDHGLYNCSVPHFDLFKPLLHCNMVVECFGNEDEENCDNQSAECGQHMVGFGTKCFRLLSSNGRLSWAEASSRCTDQGYRLVTFATKKEFQSLVEYMSKARIPSVYVGARQSQTQEPWLYRLIWRWQDGRTAFHIAVQMVPDVVTGISNEHAFPAERVLSHDRCAFLSLSDSTDVVHLPCYLSGEGFRLHYSVLCESDKTNEKTKEEGKTGEGKTKPKESKRAIVIRLARAKLHKWNVSMTQCPSSHVTRDFLSCDVQSQCGVSRDRHTCSVGQKHVAMFECQFSRQAIHYTLVCDHVQHCSDGSDEHFCQHQTCDEFGYFRCSNGQCFSQRKVCDGRADCFDATDEDCLIHDRIEVSFWETGMVRMDGLGRYTIQHFGACPVPTKYCPLNCPDSHFVCPFGHCLPVYIRCNGIVDCVGREDEAECEDYTCPGFYRCLGSKVCLHPDHVCDGMRQCPQHDDEMLCDPRCPDVCHCQGLAFVCSRRFNTSHYPDLRLLDASGSDMTPSVVGGNLFLIFLNLSRCEIDNAFSLGLPNLRILDLSWNWITHIDFQTVETLSNLVVLILSSNPLSQIINTSNVTSLPSLHSVDLSNTSIREYNSSSLSMFGSLRKLNLSYSMLSTISDEGFSSTPSLVTLDVRGSSLNTFSTKMLRELTNLKFVYSSHYKLCCQSVLPINFELHNCQSNQDLLSSCENLIRSDLYRVFVFTFALLATVGNVGSVVYRIIHQNEGMFVSSISVFVTNIALANFLTGVYLTTVAAADVMYMGDYMFNDDAWRESSVCTAVGFVFMLSQQVSSFTIFLHVLNRVLVNLFPFSTISFQRRSALVTCGVVWAMALLFALLHAVRVGALHLSAPTSMCVPLPFSRCDHLEYFTMLVLMNFTLFTAVAVGLAVIYWSRWPALERMDTHARETTVADHLATTVLTDLVCWLPIGLLAIMACFGVHVLDEISVATIMFGLPVNSAVNPFLYTFSILAEKRRKTLEDRLLRRLQTDVKPHRQQSHPCNESQPGDRSSALAQVHAWLRTKVISRRDVEACALVDPKQEELLISQSAVPHSRTF